MSIWASDNNCSTWNRHTRNLTYTGVRRNP